MTKITQLSDEPTKQNIFFLEYTAKGQLKGIKIDHKNLIELLYDMGFRRWDIGRDFTFAKVIDQVIEEVSVTDIQDSLISWVKSLPELLDQGVKRKYLIQKFYTSPGVYFNATKLSLLKPDHELKINQDTATTAYIYYKNGFVEVTENGYILKNYHELKNYIGRNQIIDRDFECLEQKNRPKDQGGIFEQFCFNVSFKESKRFEALRTIIGYSLHSFFDCKLKAVNFTDSKVSDLNEGRTGKSLLGKALGKIKNCCDIPGKDHDPGKAFKFQMADLTTQIVHLNDVKRGFDFEGLYNAISDGLVVERKNLQPFPILVKIIVSSNRPLNVDGASSRDRIVEFEFSDHYSDKFSPFDEFGKWLFTDFDKSEWAEFDNFMMGCISHYLKFGLLEVQPKNLNKRKLLQSTCPEFIEFMDEKFASNELIANKEYEKHLLHENFLTDYPEFRENRLHKQMSVFTKYLKKYVQFTEGLLIIEERKSGKDRFITFLSNEPKNIF
jgi:hypothetical protein